MEQLPSIELLEAAHRFPGPYMFKAIGRSGEVAVVILRGTGPAFCAGHDLREMMGREAAFYRRLFDVCTELMETIQSIPQPVIAQVHGAGGHAPVLVVCPDLKPDTGQDTMHRCSDATDIPRRQISPDGCPQSNGFRGRGPHPV